MDWPNILEDTCKAVITLVKQNKLQFVEEESRMKESWLKRINLKIVTPPQFETTTLEAFIKSWILQRKLSKDIKQVYQFTIEDINERCEKNFDTGIIPKELKKRLKTKGFVLSENSSVEKKKDDVWRITDDGKIFIAMRRDVWVDIYVQGFPRENLCYIIHLNRTSILLFPNHDTGRFLPDSSSILSSVSTATLCFSL